MVDEKVTNDSYQKEYDKENYILEKKEQKERAYQLIDDAIADLKTDSNFFKTYLDVQSRFDMYTPRNALLVAKQMPTAIQLKTRSDWTSLKVSFKQQRQTYITILEPGRSYMNKSGEMITPFNAKSMIDISDTNNKPTVKYYDKKFVLQAVLYDSPLSITTVDSLDGDKLCEWNQEENVIYVCRNDNADLVIHSLATEMAKINLYNDTNIVDMDKADCIAYMICKKYGIDSPVPNVENLRSKYSNIENIDIADDLTSMKKVLSDMNSKMSQYLDKKGKELHNKEQQGVSHEK